MARIYFLCLFFLVKIFSKGVLTVRQPEQTVFAAVGGPASLTCQLAENEDVVQVTWQKVLPDGKKNLATYTKDFGLKVNPELKNNMDFQCRELQDCSVEIRKVGDQDEGCYHCLFNTYPKGAVICRTCLRVYELHQPVLHVRESKSPEESVVFCSATGRPAPTVTLTVTQQHLTFSQHNTSTVNNNNNTVTVTTRAVLSGYRDDSTQVGCTVSVLSAPQIQVFQRIQTSDDGDHLDSSLEEKSRSYVQERLSQNTGIFTWIAVVLGITGVLFVLIILCYWRQKQPKARDIERNKTPLKSTQDSQDTKTPMTKQENETLRLRTSAVKSPPDDRPKRSSSLSKRLDF